MKAAIIGGLRWLLILPVLFVLANCQTSGPATTVTPQLSNDGYQAASYAAGSADGAAASMAGYNSSQQFDYKIAPYDLLQITVFQVPDLSKTFQANGAGIIVMPLIGQVPVGGLTPAQAEQDIAARLGKSYLRSPQVTVFVAKSGQRVTVNGAVRSPQVLTIEGQLTLNQAIARAGGGTDIANTTRVHLARVSGRHVQDTIYDMSQIQSGQIPDPVLQGGDIVVVEDAFHKILLRDMRSLLPFIGLMTLL